MFSQVDIVNAFTKMGEQDAFETQKLTERSKINDSLICDILQNTVLDAQFTELREATV